MAIKVGPYSSLVSMQGEFSRSSARLSSAFERLSSGLRVNSASDDTAGLALSAGLDINSRLQSQSSKNVNDAISLINIAESALTEIEGIATHIQELAEQAATGTLNASQRNALSTEYSALSQEISRIADSTTFNGISVFGNRQATLGDFEQITSYASTELNNTQLAVSGDGRYAIVLSSADSEVQRINTETGSVQTLIGGVTNLSQLQVSLSGNRVAFISNNNLTGENGAGYSQVYLYDVTSSALSQITNAQGVELFLGFDFSDDGSTIAFSSQTLYEGGATYQAFQEIIFYDVDSDTLRESGYISYPSAAGNFHLSANGDHLAFVSTANVGGANSDNSAEQWVMRTSDNFSSATQITSVTGAGSIRGSAANNGDVYFVSAANLTGQNAGGYQQIFRYAADSADVTQLSSASATVSPYIYFSADSEELVFISAPSYFDGSGSSYEAMHYNSTTGVVTQLSDFGGFTAGAITVSSDLQQLLLLSSSDYDDNADGSVELYRVKFSPPQDPLSLQIGVSSADMLTVQLPSYQHMLDGLGGFILSNTDSSRGAIESAERNLQTLHSSRAELAASLSRLEVAMSMTEALALGYREASDRIRSVDVAQETANVVRDQILQRSIGSVVSQIKINANLVLELLAP